MAHVRVDEQVKAQAAETLAEQQLPFILKMPNVETRAAMTEADEICAARNARYATANELFDDLEKNSGK